MITSIFEVIEPTFFEDKDGRTWPRVAVSCNTIEESIEVADFLGLSSQYYMNHDSNGKNISIGRHDPGENYMFASDKVADDPNFIGKHRAIHISYEVFMLNKNALVQVMETNELYKILGMEATDDSRVQKKQS